MVGPRPPLQFLAVVLGLFSFSSHAGGIDLPARVEVRRLTSAEIGLRQAGARGLSLAAADFDADGISDLAVGVADSRGRGQVAILAGGGEALYPHRLAASAAPGTKAAAWHPFYAARISVELPLAPDLLASGDFDADGHLDLVAGSRGERELWWLAGDGAGGFTEAQAWPLPGRLVGLADGEFGARDGLKDLALTVEGDKGDSARLLVLASPRGALAGPARIVPLPAMASGLTFGYLAGDLLGDVAVVAGDETIVAAGRKRGDAAAPLVERYSAAELAGAGAESSAAEAQPVWRSQPAIGAPGEEMPLGELVARLAADPSESFEDSNLLLSDFTKAAALSLRLTPDALTDTVLLGRGGELISLVTVPQVTFTVNSTADSDDSVCSGVGGGCTLREAINAANTNAGLDEIAFDLGTGNPTITLTAALPTVAGSVTIDGATGGATRVVIDCDDLVTHGLELTLPGNTVRNLVIHSCNGSGIKVTSTGGANFFEGNYLGTDAAGTGDLGNGEAGLNLSGSTGNTVGGTTAAARNVLSGNGLYGVWTTYVSVSPTPTSNVIQGNYIGVDATGSAALANDTYGILVWDADGVTIGGTAAGAGNVISGNASGISIEHTTFSIPFDTVVQGNFIGSDVTGTIDRGNTINGIGMGFAQDTLIGGTTVAARNVVSGNDNAGILLSWMDNTVQGNYIGTDLTGTVALGNGVAGGWGVLATGQGHLIGGTDPGAGNLISGNNGTGLRLNGTFGTNGITVQGNRIGTDVSGTFDLGNVTDGVLLDATADQIVGGTSAAARNLISGNDRFGIFLATGGSGSVIQGNYVGTDVTGTGALANSDDGIRVGPEPIDNTIGGTVAGAGNLVSGNGGDGIELQGSPGDGNLVQGNFIGTNAVGTAAVANAGNGVRILGGWHTLGGSAAGAANLISGNGASGVRASGSGSTLQGNRIGSEIDGVSVLPNTLHGVHLATDLFAGSTSSIAVGGVAAGEGNVIAFNGGDGVFAESPTFGTITGNPIRGNAIHSNSGGLGIDLGADGVTANDSGDGDSGANDLQNFPVLTNAFTSGGSTTIEGTLASSGSYAFTVDLYRAATCDPSGNGEGDAYLGSVAVVTNGSGSGSFSLTVPTLVPSDEFVTATATNGAGSTSEFGVCRNVVGLIFADGFESGDTTAWSSAVP